MGGCATKPKADAPKAAPAPEPVKEEPADSIPEVKEVVVLGGQKEAVDDDEHANRRQSLSNLFKENEGKESTEHVETPTDAEKLEEAKVMEKHADIPEAGPQGPGRVETVIEQTPREIVEAPAEAKLVKAETAEGHTETQQPEESKTETPKDKEVITEEAPVIEAEKPEKTEVVMGVEDRAPEETQISESCGEKRDMEGHVEKKVDDVKSAMEAEKPDSSEKKEEEKMIPVAEAKNPGAKSPEVAEEKKTEEEK